MKSTTINIFKTLLMCLLFMAHAGCKKFLEMPPPRNSIVGDVVFNDNAGAIAAQNAVFIEMANGNMSDYCQRPNLSADEWLYYGSDPSVNQLSKNSITSDNNETKSIWADGYKVIYDANAVIEGILGATGISQPVKKELLAEAKFCRAFEYFYLVNLFGDVPLVLTTDYKKNAVLSRTKADIIYDQIIADLLEAQSTLSDKYLDGQLMQTSTERLRPNKAVVTALLARVYLYREQWLKAETEASKLINDPMYYLEPNLDNIFLTGSKEAIWQLPSSNESLNTWEGYNYVGISTRNPVTVALNPSFLNVFEPDDIRKGSWIGTANVAGGTYYYPYKYKVYQSSLVTEYEAVFRLAEIYLIRAEARAQLNNIVGLESAQSDIDKVRSRAGLGSTSATSKDEMLTAILHERQVELFSEFGHRWLDLKRTKKINQVMETIAPAKNSSWDPRQALYPIPAQDILNNKNLLPNNPGY